MKLVDGGLNDPLHNLQRNFVSNAVSNAKKLVNAMANLSGQKVLRFGEMWTSERGREQEIWHDTQADLGSSPVRPND
jgi:hypothetical protein